MAIKKMNKLSGDDEMVRLYTKLSRREMEFKARQKAYKERGSYEVTLEEMKEKGMIDFIIGSE